MAKAAVKAKSKGASRSTSRAAISAERGTAPAAEDHANRAGLLGRLRGVGDHRAGRMHDGGTGEIAAL